MSDTTNQPLPPVSPLASALDAPLGGAGQATEHAMPIEIRHRITNAILYTSQRKTLRDAVVEAVGSRADLSRAYLSGADLSGADLSGADLSRAYLSRADLSRADLSGANLSGANLSGAYLSRADLSGADLSGADLSGAYLSRADLSGARINWQSHALLSEILWRAAGGNPAREQLAAWIGRKTGWCWKNWIRVQHPEREWALGVLIPLAAKDPDAPEQLRKLAPAAEAPAAAMRREPDFESENE